ncbi:uncharacterized protein LOC123720773 [Pieris brassicae]|uniref:uncharacterized protein LOC123720773 n=1 Tax=Pieris brassicae TaxID=7116 RepID=UPI001E65F5B7|nr:uncharacterized protein LOC123720773 [Pieris brassicae]
MPKRCAFGCSPNDASLDSFPNPKRFHQQLNSWVNLTGDFGLTNEEIFRDHNGNNRLNALAIPSLYLNGFHGKLPYPSEMVSQKMELNTQSDTVACGSASTSAVTTQQNVKHNMKRSSKRHSEYAAIMLDHGYCKKRSSKASERRAPSKLTVNSYSTYKLNLNRRIFKVVACGGIIALRFRIIYRRCVVSTAWYMYTTSSRG